MNSATLVQKLWIYCNGSGLGRSLARSPAREHAGARVDSRLSLRDDGMSDGDNVEQLTCLLFSTNRMGNKDMVPIWGTL